MNKKFEKAKADAREKVLGALPKDVEEVFEKAFDLGYDIGYLIIIPTFSVGTFGFKIP